MSFAAPVDPDRARELLASAVRDVAADHVDATLLARAGEYTRFAGERVHQPQDITEHQVVVRAVVAGHAARVSTSRVDRVPDAVRRATAIARDLARTAGKPGGAWVSGEPGADDQVLRHADTEAFDAGARVAIAADAMGRARAAGTTAAGMVGRALTQLAVASSAGTLRHVLATEAIGSLTVGDRDGSAHWANLHRSSDALGVDVAGTVERAVRSRGRRPLPDGQYTVVLGPEATGELLGFLGVLGFEGGLADAGVGVVAGRAGGRAASRLVTVADDAFHPFGLPIPFDQLGTPKVVVPLLTDGLVGAAVTERTGHAHVAREAAPATVAANVVMAAGTETEASLIAGVDDGLYVERFWYTRLVDRQAGTITGVSRDACFRITDGALGEPVAGARFTQSVFDLLATVDGVGAELRSQPIMNVWNGSVTAPAVRGHGFRFGPR
ncbi:metallopeptidase TldD-related protein [Actinosynnema sp. NPDC020468]|uniref:metallopeptidase TldD-related protein n=1 Tax=Actinosynnema sp. NPDC020468 TaxID=3154488 RepID=UPI003405643A